jgi:circadian clock protein KaiB
MLQWFAALGIPAAVAGLHLGRPLRALTRQVDDLAELIAAVIDFRVTVRRRRATAAGVYRTPSVTQRVVEWPTARRLRDALPGHFLNAQRPPDGSGNPPMSATTLKLYVVSGTPSSDRAIAAIEQLHAALPGDVTVEVVDLGEHPEVAESERIVATPMLVRLAPEPMRRVVGDLSDLDRVRWGLGLGVV